MKIYLGADHRGFKLKEEVFQYLVNQGYEVEDFGAYELVKSDDYTEYAGKVASVVGDYYVDKEKEGKEKRGEVRGILFCGSGVGVDIVANKFDGVRASLGKEVGQIEKGRSDDDMNILVIASDFTTKEEAKRLVKLFLETKFTGKYRYKRRLEEIKKIEKNN
jgi:ribose 5-phosphate isomerase B